MLSSREFAFCDSAKWIADLHGLGHWDEEVAERHALHGHRLMFTCCIPLPPGLTTGHKPKALVVRDPVALAFEWCGIRFGLVAEPVASCNLLLLLPSMLSHLLSYRQKAHFRWGRMVDLAHSSGELLHVPPRHRGVGRELLFAADAQMTHLPPRRHHRGT